MLAIGSLKQLRHLKALSIAGQLITGHASERPQQPDPDTMLPASLEVLTINSSSEGDSAFEQLFTRLPALHHGEKPSLPSLRHVKLRAWKRRELYISTHFLDQLRPVFVRSNITLLGPKKTNEHYGVTAKPGGYIEI
ncbi:uncharacterized protein K452DRAFT_157137 [Aplosporella prunicola CBS 121167]|uniref:Uncharacterized protein n=1 Tax=Aplosporella prunicola CBS 121167 TaxID=1176127 RepID=A0A6A6BJM6_9PEZI|nr:uncharacterized protein K452DRAFT_157137 [Aplosporella prunicola CBS 121167]KAF2144349.1 hypothetical protein K452DRAFT_157137 [Aplosporella prunicola CBS 121167]